MTSDGRHEFRIRHWFDTTCENAASAEYMFAYDYKDQSPSTHHTRSERTNQASSPLPFTVQDPVSHLPCYPPQAPEYLSGLLSMYKLTRSL